MAGLVANPVHSIPGPTAIPDVPLVDPELKHNTPAVTRTLMERMQAAASSNAEVQLTGAECFGEIHSTRLVNSRGIDAEQESTALYLEFVLHSQRSGQDRETFTDIRRRRVADLDIEREIERRTRHTLDQFEAGPPPLWHGPVVIRGETLATFMAGDSLGGGVIQTLGSAESKYAKFSPWEIGKSVLRKDASGDPLNIWANRCLPYGTHSDRFDEEGLPAQRVELIRENQLVAFTASQRYAEYLDLPATGAFGAVEVAPGSTPTSALLEEPYVEVVQFSWFNPDGITGDFATEIRFGYMVENGVPRPFRGGQLVGNFLDALADVRWSKETSMYGKYSGPEIARFNSLKIVG
jgi:PmbA protein